ncbi:MAG: flagellar export chaperone FliS [Eubacterium sp.]|nr:flagellar export chaperone FliS [Eubacterium sp.]
MNQQQAYNTYMRNKILTASPGELTLMLYEGCIRFINIAANGIDENDLQKTHNHILKAEAVISELQSTLNYKYPVANDFNNIYVYVKQRLVEANMNKDKEILEEVARHMRSLRDTWKEVMKRAPSQRA